MKPVPIIQRVGFPYAPYPEQAAVPQENPTHDLVEKIAICQAQCLQRRKYGRQMTGPVRRFAPFQNQGHAD
jgi:hypothetical protein